MDSEISKAGMYRAEDRKQLKLVERVQISKVIEFLQTEGERDQSPGNTHPSHISSLMGRSHLSVFIHHITNNLQQSLLKGRKKMPRMSYHS